MHEESAGGEVTPAVGEVTRPASGDRSAWRTYWHARGQPWRTEREIDAERQAFLTQRLRIPPHVGRGMYLFGGVTLGRADVEWLLATHENGRGFFPGGIPLDDPLTVLAAAQAVVGLIIEISFIATFTQRFFGK